MSFLRTAVALTVLAMSHAASAQTTQPLSGNPLFKGWYADPDAVIFGDRYFIYPTTSDKYEKQTFFDAFSSPDLVHWTKHPRILSTDEVKWAHKAMWAPCATRAKAPPLLSSPSSPAANLKSLDGLLPETYVPRRRTSG